MREQEEMGPEMDALVAQLVVGLSALIWVGGEFLGLGRGCNVRWGWSGSVGALSALAGSGLTQCCIRSGNNGHSLASTPALCLEHGNSSGLISSVMVSPRRPQEWPQELFLLCTAP